MKVCISMPKLMSQEICLLLFAYFYVLDYQDQLGDVLHWVRQAIAVVCGIVWGAIPLTGVVWLIM
jgi:hypothetical protein